MYAAIPATVWEYDTSTVLVRLHASQDTRTNPRPIAIAAGADYHKVCWMGPAGRLGDEGFQQVRMPAFGGSLPMFDTRGDGVILNHPQSAAILRSADCPTAIIVTREGRVLMLHCGRAALTPHFIRGTGNRVTLTPDNIIINAVRNCITMGNIIDQVIMTGGICPTHFTHENAMPLVQPFIEWCPHAVGDKGALDLKAVVEHSFRAWLGTPPDEELPFPIIQDGICSFEDKRLASVRAGRDGADGVKLRNPVLVIKK